MANLSVFLRIFLLIGVASSILWLSLDSDPPMPSWTFLSWDKFQHALAYAVLSLAVGGALQHFFRSPWKTWTMAFALSLSYGVGIEFLQKYLTHNRQFEFLDILADALGAFLAAFCAYWWHRSQSLQKEEDT